MNANNRDYGRLKHSTGSTLQYALWEYPVYKCVQLLSNQTIVARPSRSAADLEILQTESGTFFILPDNFILNQYEI